MAVTVRISTDLRDFTEGLAVQVEGGRVWEAFGGWVVAGGDQVLIVRATAGGQA